jgi:hypothetical protein
MPAVRNRSDVLVRLVSRCETATAMRTCRTPPLRLLLATALLAALLLPGWVGPTLSHIHNSEPTRR